MSSDDEIFAGVAEAIDSVPAIGINRDELTRDLRIDDLDSLQVLELREQLEERLDQRISVRRIMRSKTLGDIVAFFKQRNASLRKTNQPA